MIFLCSIHRLSLIHIWVVYPYPVIESMSDEKVDKEYNAIFIENEYIKVMIPVSYPHLTNKGEPHTYLSDERSREMAGRKLHRNRIG